MVQAHSTTAPTVGKWRISLKQQTCEACGRSISPGQSFLWFPWSPIRRHSISCVLCGTTAAVEVAA